MEKNNLCGLTFDNISSKELEVYLEDSYKKKRNIIIVTPNVDFIVRANKESRFKNIVNSSNISLCDSSIVMFSSYLLGKKLKEKITGFDATVLLLNMANKFKEKIYLLGSIDENLIAASKNIKKNYPKLEITGLRSGYFKPEESISIIENINRSDANILFVGMGSPKQEYWVFEHRNMLKAKIIICVGGLFNVLSGKIKRAPRILQLLGLEWFWRLMMEPKRLWKRYLIDDSVFFWLVLRQKLASLK